MSNTAINWAYEVTAGGYRNKAVLVALANFANDDGKCWPFIRTLVKATELCDRAVRSALADLEKRRLISRQPQFLDGTQYRRNELITLHLDMVQDVQDDGAPDAGYPAPDAGYGASDAGYIRHDMPEHPASGAGHIEPSLNLKKEPREIAPSAAPAPEPISESKEPKTKRKTQLPPDWKPTERDIAHATKKGLSERRINEEAEGFFDWHTSHGNVMFDWSAAWRTWIRRIKRASPSRRTGGDEQISRVFANEIVAVLGGGQ